VCECAQVIRRGAVARCMDCFSVEVSTVCNTDGVILRGAFKLQPGDSETKAAAAVGFLADGLRACVTDAFHPDRRAARGVVVSDGKLVVEVHTQDNLVRMCISSI